MSQWLTQASLAGQPSPHDHAGFQKPVRTLLPPKIENPNDQQVLTEYQSFIGWSDLKSALRYVEPAQQFGGLAKRLEGSA